MKILNQSKHVNTDIHVTLTHWHVSAMSHRETPKKIMLAKTLDADIGYIYSEICMQAPLLWASNLVAGAWC